MSSIKGSFQIKINDQAVAPVDDNGEDQIQASFGPDAAVFTLTDGRLESNGWYLGRYLVEDRSLLPKRVYWFRKGSGVEPDWIHLVSAEPAGTSYSLLFSGAPLINEDNMLFADLMKDQPASVEVTMVV